MVLALSSEDADKVSAFIDSNGYTVRTAAGGKSSAAYGVKGIPKAFLIAPDGTIAWSGHPAGLSTGTVEQVLEDAQKPPSSFLSVRPSAESGKALASAVDAARAGKLAKARAAAEKVAAAGTDDAAQVLVADIDKHLDRLIEAAARSVKQLDLVAAVEVYGAISKDAKGTAQAAEADKQLAAIESDPDLKRELQAAEAFEKTKASVAKLSTSKKRGKFQKFAKKYDGTHAGKRAKSISR